MTTDATCHLRVVCEGFGYRWTDFYSAYANVPGPVRLVAMKRRRFAHHHKPYAHKSAHAAERAMQGPSTVQSRR